MSRPPWLPPPRHHPLVLLCLLGPMGLYQAERATGWVARSLHHPPSDINVWQPRLLLLPLAPIFFQCRSQLGGMVAHRPSYPALLRCQRCPRVARPCSTLPWSVWCVDPGSVAHPSHSSARLIPLLLPLYCRLALCDFGEFRSMCGLSMGTTLIFPACEQRSDCSTLPLAMGQSACRTLP